MGEHTPGPWEQLGNMIFSPGNGVVCQLSLPHPQDGLVRHAEAPLSDRVEWDKAMSNGKLIILAPEFLAVCEALVEYRANAGALNFQLEKADYFIREMELLIDKLKADNKG